MKDYRAIIRERKAERSNELAALAKEENELASLIQESEKAMDAAAGSGDFAKYRELSTEAEFYKARLPRIRQKIMELQNSQTLTDEELQDAIKEVQAEGAKESAELFREAWKDWCALKEHFAAHRQKIESFNLTLSIIKAEIRDGSSLDKYSVFPVDSGKEVEDLISHGESGGLYSLKKRLGIPQ